MPLTPDESFERFSARYVNVPSQTTTDTRFAVESLLHELRPKYLKWLPNGLEITPYGSFARGTATKALSVFKVFVTVDSVSILKASDDLDSPRFLAVDPNTRVSVYHNGGNHDANALAVQIREALVTHPNVTQARVENNATVVFSIEGQPLKIGITPALGVKGQHGATRQFFIPSGGDKWRRFDPQAQARRFDDIDVRHGGHFLPLVRLLKYWNEECSSRKLTREWLETAAVRIFESDNSQPLQSVREGFPIYFEHQIAEVGVPPHSIFDGNAIDPLGEDDHKVLLENYALMAKLGRDAMALERKGDLIEANKSWQRIIRQGYDLR